MEGVNTFMFFTCMHIVSWAEIGYVLNTSQSKTPASFDEYYLYQISSLKANAWRVTLH